MRYVLFVCNHNAGRSQMAQAFFERDAPEDIRAESAGSEPAVQLWPGVIEAMAETGIDIAERRPRKLLRENRIEEIRTDPTAHRPRLAAILPALIEESGGRRPDSRKELVAG